MAYEIEKKQLAAQPVLVARRRVKRSEIATAITEVLPTSSSTRSSTASRCRATRSLAMWRWALV